MPQYENAERAERLFKARQLQKADAPKATADFYAAEQAVRDRTQELRQLRLARDAHKKSDLASQAKRVLAAATGRTVRECPQWVIGGQPQYPLYPQ